ncbi:MAG: class I SAM-dependent methyltransferase [Gammaproteobacteria bacterium]|nr:class I SAM-dependent methyltransferase [Gammaproteobacteria bacterium]
MPADQPASHSVRRHLNVAIEAYDRTIRQFIPGYEEGIARAAELVARARPGWVLDLGAGTGALAAAMLAREGVGEVALIDVDGEMLAQARVRLAAFGERAAFHEQSFDASLPGCDAVAASLALHHVPTMARKMALYARIHAALRPGGVFVNADVTMPAEAALQEATYERWAQHLVASGIEPHRAREHFAEWADEDTYLPLDEELAALREVGFEAECVWQETPFSLVVGRKGG